MAELTIDGVAGMDGVNQEALGKLIQALNAIIQTTLDMAATQVPQPAPFQRQRSQKVQHTRLSKGKSCDNMDASRPDWKPRAKGLHASGHLQFPSHNGTPTAKTQFGTVMNKMKKSKYSLSSVSVFFRFS